MADNNTKEMAKKETQVREGVEPTREGRMFMPPTDILENNENIVLVADMPGVGADDVDITLEKDVLTVHGTVGDARRSDGQPAYAEYDVGNFQRSFSLTSEIDRDNIQANMNNGVLTLTLPKTSPSRKKIEVKSG